VGLGVAGIFLVGLVAGSLVSGALPAFASENANGPSATSTPATRTKSDYCTLYEQALANGLKIKTSVLEQANSAALQAVINQLYKDGKIDAQQEAKLKQQATSSSTSPCANLSDVIWQHSGQGHQGNGALAGAYQAVVAQVASTLHLTTTQLQSDLDSGQTVTQIASAQKVDISVVKAKYLSTLQAQLAKAVSAGKLSQQQSSAIYQRFENAANSGQFPFLDHGANRHTSNQA
jgi:hypothetical protein